MSIGFQCRCGSLRGEIEPGHALLRARCYCLDCQAFAHALGHGRDTLDGQGGSDVAAMLPAGVRFTAGTEHLACLSLSPKGLLRWHSSCCNTAIANTPRNPKFPYVGVLARCVDGDPDAAFGPVRFAVGTKSAQGDVAATPVRTTLGVMRTMLAVAWARLRGGHRVNPFFDGATGQPVVQPRVLDKAERMAVTPAKPRT